MVAAETQPRLLLNPVCVFDQNVLSRAGGSRTCHEEAKNRDEVEAVACDDVAALDLRPCGLRDSFILQLWFQHADFPSQTQLHPLVRRNWNCGRAAGRGEKCVAGRDVP